MARHLELEVVTEMIESATHGVGGCVLITGEPGIGKTRLLREARIVAEQRGLVVLRGRAVESGGAYRPLVEAFARPAARYAGHPDLVGVRPTLARVLPGWLAEPTVLAPMADPAAVLAGALILLLQTLAPNGAVLMLDDLHWADPDTLSALSFLVDSVDTLPLALVLAARGEVTMPPALHELAQAEPVRKLPLRRLTSDEVADAVRESQLIRLPPDQLEQLITAADGLPLIIDEFVRQLQERGSQAGSLDLGRSTLASAVRLRLAGVTPDCRSALDALSVVGDSDPEVLAAATGMEPDRLGRALHAGLSSTLLVAARNPLGIMWRHILIGEAVRDLLLPLEQQAIARRAAGQLASGTAPTDGQLRQAARLYESAGDPQQAAQQFVRAARLAVKHAALDAAEQYLQDAQELTGAIPDSAREVLIERIQTLVVAGRAGDAYESGLAALDGTEDPDARRLLVATARAAYAAGRYPEGRNLLTTLERGTESPDAELLLLRAYAAYADRRPESIEAAHHAAVTAEQQGGADLACEALVLAGMAARRHGGLPERDAQPEDQSPAVQAFRQAMLLSRRHDLAAWEVRAQAELGVTDMITKSDPTRLLAARDLATTAGMVGTVAQLDMDIGKTEVTRGGFLAAYQSMLRANTQARRLHLTALQGRTACHLAECYLLADHPLPGTTGPPTPAEIERVISEGTQLADKTNAAGLRSAVGVRAWLHGDNPTAIRMIDSDLRQAEDEVKAMPWWGFARLLRVIEDVDRPETFAALDLLGGHHCNWAARALGVMISQLRAGEPADAALAEAERFLHNTPFWRHLLQTVVAPAAFEAGMPAAEGWLREADAFFGAAGEQPLQRRARQSLLAIGGKLPRTGASVPPHLARFGITAREAEILRLVKAGLANTEIAERLFISVRTVETHVSSMLQKTGTETRDRLPLP